jgi:ATPase subunit of ABC transporter with duplicated ATPase domains
VDGECGIELANALQNQIWILPDEPKNHMDIEYSVVRGMNEVKAVVALSSHDRVSL